MSRGSSATITTRPIPLTFVSGAIPGPLRGVVLGLSCGVVLDGPIRGSRAIFTALLAFSVPRRSDGSVRRSAPAGGPGQACRPAVDARARRHRDALRDARCGRPAGAAGGPRLHSVARGAGDPAGRQRDPGDAGAVGGAPCRGGRRALTAPESRTRLSSRATQQMEQRAGGRRDEADNLHGEHTSVVARDATDARRFPAKRQ